MLRPSVSIHDYLDFIPFHLGFYPFWFASTASTDGTVPNLLMPAVVLSVSHSRSICSLSTPANLADASDHSDPVLVDVLRSMLEGSGLGAITRDNLIGETIFSLATILRL